MFKPASPPAPALPAHGHGHAHDQGDGHGHGHGHGHDHGGSHHHHAPATASLRLPPSLLMAGVGSRLLGVAGLLLLLWAAVAWALGEPA